MVRSLTVGVGSFMQLPKLFTNANDINKYLIDSLPPVGDPDTAQLQFYTSTHNSKVTDRFSLQEVSDYDYKNLRLVSILFTLSKVLGYVMCIQIRDFFINLNFASQSVRNLGFVLAVPRLWRMSWMMCVCIAVDSGMSTALV